MSKDIYKSGDKFKKVSLGEVETVYRCGSCGEEYETKAEAKKCCVEYECSECGTTYETKAEAVACCLVYGCYFCGEEYGTEKEAVECAKKCAGKESNK